MLSSDPETIHYNKKKKKLNISQEPNSIPNNLKCTSLAFPPVTEKFANIQNFSFVWPT